MDILEEVLKYWIQENLTPKHKDNEIEAHVGLV
jgi:hypothetical protein